MKARLKLAVLIFGLLASQPATADSLMSNWSQVVGKVLSRMPVLEGVGEKILANRIAFIDVSETSAGSQLTNARVKTDLGAMANVRARPGTNAESKVIAQLRPGQRLNVTGRVAERAWFRIRLADGRTAYVHQNLIELD
jgi:uncharacterized protein YgiM (DUF1202 family)